MDTETKNKTEHETRIEININTAFFLSLPEIVLITLIHLFFKAPLIAYSQIINIILVHMLVN